MSVHPTATIRPAGPADAEAIARLHGDIVDQTLWTFTTQRRPAEAWRQEIQTAAPFLVADSTDSAAGGCFGFAAVSGFRSGPGYAQTGELSIYLAERARGQGLGRRLLTELEGFACAAGLHVLVAAISGANPAAEMFHAACGYDRVGRLPEVGQKWGQRLDLVLMQKILRDQPAG